MYVLGVTEACQDETEDWNLVPKNTNLFKRKDLLGSGAVGSEPQGDMHQQRNP